MKNTDQSLSMVQKRAKNLIETLRIATKEMPLPMSELIKIKYDNDPFLILISCLLSLRARDVVTYPISIALFEQARTPQEFVKMPLAQLEKIIRPIGFFRNKARTIKSVSADILKRFKGKVPSNQADLLSIKGIGIKTANLVLGVAFNIPAICVDTHVHKITNKVGLVKTKTAEQTEQALQKIIPCQNWIEFNSLLVKWGQNICSPRSPLAIKCPIYDLGERVGIKRSTLKK